MDVTSRDETLVRTLITFSCSYKITPQLFLCLLIGPQVVWEEPPGKDWSPRQLWPAPQHGALLLPRALTQRHALLQSQQPQRRWLAPPKALPLRALGRGDASWEGLWLWPLHCLLLQHRRRWVIFFTSFSVFGFKQGSVHSSEGPGHRGINALGTVPFILSKCPH